MYVDNGFWNRALLLLFHTKAEEPLAVSLLLQVTAGPFYAYLFILNKPPIQHDYI
jgi:hypothetical protein